MRGVYPGAQTSIPKIAAIPALLNQGDEQQFKTFPHPIASQTLLATTHARTGSGLRLGPRMRVRPTGRVYGVQSGTQHRLAILPE